jgi:hypothetical protein
MPERIAASIMIGGRLHQSRLSELLDAITQAGVSLDWGDAVFNPTTADDLLKAVRDGHLWLCDDHASWGEFPELEETCRTLRLGYTRHSDSGAEYDAELVDWRSGMSEPLVRVASNCGKDTYVPHADVNKVLRYLELNRVTTAKKALQRLCPHIPALSAFRIV